MNKLYIGTDMRVTLASLTQNGVAAEATVTGVITRHGATIADLEFTLSDNVYVTVIPATTELVSGNVYTLSIVAETEDSKLTMVNELTAEYKKGDICH